MVEVRDFIDSHGQRPFARWFNRLDPAAARRVRVALARIAAGNLSHLKGVGGGVLERRVHYGPGYRIYLGLDGEESVILLAGGTKSRQQQDIKRARERWREYKRLKREEI